MNQPLVVHETTYRRRDLAGIIHRNRLRAVVRTFCRYVDSDTRSWADFGCSNGFIIEEIVKLKRYSFTRLAGFDNTPELIERAREKQIPAAEFHLFDLNAVVASPETFDLVTCMETLEHVGHLENAIANLVAHVRAGGLLLLTVPNETGLAGLIKYFGRLAVSTPSARPDGRVGGRTLASITGACRTRSTRAT
jgi:2-polyprenyl-3-methyl-5-hydroxy-6-metoxy-1,4-benzoquinol methylase